MTEDDQAALLNSHIVPASKPEGFAASDLITCEACQRANPPNRASCIYCGAHLSTRAAEEEPALALPAPSAAAQSTYCLVLAANQPQQITESDATQIASLLKLKLKPGELKIGMDAGGPLPLLSAASAEETNGFMEELRGLGMEAFVIAEEAFAANHSFRKIRALEFSDESVSALPASAGEQPVTWSELILVVTGRLVTNRVEVEEKQKRGSAKPTGTRQLSADESLMDLFITSYADAWRIYANSFDFSCLGARKGVTAFENFAALINLIRERAANVEIDESYHRKRLALASVWPVEEKSSKREWTLSGARKFNFSTVTTTDNESQFNKYSQLVHYLRLRERGTAE